MLFRIPIGICIFESKNLKYTARNNLVYFQNKIMMAAFKMKNKTAGVST